MSEPRWNINSLSHCQVANISASHMFAMRDLHVKPAFHGACFGAVSAPILSARVPLRASAAFEKDASTMNIVHVSMGADCRAD